MKAAICRQYGGPEVLQIETIEKPTPKDDEICVKIVATAVNISDVRLRAANPKAVRLFFGLFAPKINVLGNVFSGVVESVGKNATRYRVGDAVFGMTDMALRTHAEYVCIAESGAIAPKPANMSHVEAATVPFGAHTAHHFLKKAHVTVGQKALVYGASGAVGVAMVQMLKHLGAHVTAVCSTGNVAMVKSLGADVVWDYTKGDVLNTDARFDLVADVVNKAPVGRLARLLNPKGTLILSAAMLTETLQGLWVAITTGKKLLNGLATVTAADMAFFQTLIESVQYKAVVDKTFPLEDIRAAHQYVEGGHKKGNVAVTVSMDNCRTARRGILRGIAPMRYLWVENCKRGGVSSPRDFGTSYTFFIMAHHEASAAAVRTIELDSFSNALALEMGLAIVRLAESRGQNVAVEIARLNHPVFLHVGDNLPADKLNWLRRKANVAKHFEESSLSVKNDLAAGNMALDTTFALDARDFLAKGGAMPLFVKNAGLVAVVTVSGLRDTADHDLIVEALTQLLGDLRVGY